MTFGKPPYKNIDMNIWNPLVPTKFHRYLPFTILAVSFLAAAATILMLRQNSYSETIYNVTFNGIIYRFLPEASRIFAITLAVIIRLIYVFILIFFHEFLHVVCYPKYGREHTYIYFDRKTGALSPIYNGDISRERRLLVNAMPIIILSCGIYIISFFAQNDLRNILRITALANLALSCADIIGLFLLLRLPSKAVLYIGVWRRK